MHKANCFITLTYSDEHIPKTGSLEHRDFQLFMKRLRKHVGRNKQKSKQEPTKGTPPLPQRATENRENKFSLKAKSKIRFYMAGEYGENTKRAHYHACIFGYDFPDKKYWRTTGSKARLYTSEQLNKLWGKGHTTIGEVNFESAAYVARYIMKKVNGDRAKKHYEEIDAETGEIKTRKPEYNKMSLRPGIGSQWLERYATDAYPEGKIVVRGHKSKTPKYYDKKYAKLDPLGYEDLLFERDKEGQKRAGDNTVERLAAKETVAKAQIAFLKRNLT